MSEAPSSNIARIARRLVMVSNLMQRTAPRRREAFRRGLRRLLDVALVCALLAAQTPAAPRVLSGLAPRWRADAIYSLFSSSLAGGGTALARLTGWLSLTRFEPGLPPAKLAPTAGQPAASGANAALPTFRVSSPAAPLYIAAPANLTVTQSSANQINLSWSPAAGAAHYRVERAERLTGAFSFVADTAQTAFSDTTVSGGPPVRAYLYRVLAVDSGGNFSPWSTFALGTAVSFTDPDLGVLGLRAMTEHVNELRQSVNAVRRVADIPEVTSWVDNTLQKGVTPIRAAHVQQLRDKLNEALAELDIPTPSFADPDLGSAPNGALIRKIHFEQLRERSTRGASASSSGGISITLTSPVNNSTYSDGSTVTVSAAVSGGGVAKVEFFRGATKIGEDTAAPYSVVWANIPEGSHTLTALATDASGATATSPPVQVGAVNFTAARLDPANRTGGSGADLLSRNFNWSLPVVSLPGRSGHDLGLSLSYNSLVWTKSGPWMLFDGDWGFPAPGFRLGFPTVQHKFYNTQAQKHAYLLIAPSGARVELRQTAAADTYEATDSSYLQLKEKADGSLSVRATDGAEMAYWPAGGVYRCTEIKDRNGNFITINHDAFGNVQTVVDTLGRTITFEYDGADLRRIKQTWQRETASGGAVTETRDWAIFYYEDKPIQTNFEGSSLLGAQNGQTIRALTKVMLGDDSYFTFGYTTWGQVNQIARYAADDHLLNYVSYNLPADAGTTQTDCPRFTQERVWAEQWRGDDNGVPAAGEESAVVYNEFNFAGGVAHATTPDGTKYQELYETSGWKRGLTTRTETFSADDLNNPKKWATVEWTQDDEALPFQQNPRAKEKNVYDSEGNRRRMTVSYTSFGLPQEVFEYAADATTVLRRQQTTYLPASVADGAAYTDRRVIGLPEETRLYGRVGGQEQLASKLTFEYDLTGGFLVSAGTPTQHKSADYGPAFAVRGNLCRVKRWDVEDPDNSNKAVKSEVGYNTTGSEIFSRDGEGHTTDISYADSDGGDTLAYPTKVTDPDGFFSTAEYNYGLGLVTRAVDPKGAAAKTLYDARGRSERRVVEANGAYVRWEYPASGRYVQQFAVADTGEPEMFTAAILDGAGRTRATLQKLPVNYAGQRFVYDAMGRQTQESNPAEVSINVNNLADVAGWQPSGEDAAGGWNWTTQTNDWQGRPLVITNPDLTTKEFSYDGCGCAGGEEVTFTDEGTRLSDGTLKRRRSTVRYDVLGRAVRSRVFDWDNNVSSTVTDYNPQDQVVAIKEYQGQETGDGSCPTNTCQQTTQTYDGHGRLKTRKVPAETNPTTYAYNADDTVQKATDARNASSNYEYNGRHLVEGVTYDLPGGVAATPDVSYEYDSAGNRTLMTEAGLGQVTYQHDTLSRLQQETRSFSGLTAGFTLSYEYTLSGKLKKITYPSIGDVNYDYNPVGQLVGMTKAQTGRQFPAIIKDIKYRAWGGIKQIENGDYSEFSYSATYNNVMQMSRVTLKAMVSEYVGRMDEVTFLDYNLEYHEDGRVKKYTYASNPSVNINYTYDHAERLVGASWSNPLWNQTYGYDRWNNLTARVGGYRGAAPPPFSATYQNNRNGAWGYDTAGNLTNDGTRGYGYDAENRPASVTASNTSQFYDGNGQSIKVVRDGETKYYLRSSAMGGAVVAELDAQGQRLVSYLYAEGFPVARLQPDPEHPWFDKLYYSYSDPVTSDRYMFAECGVQVYLNAVDPLGNEVVSSGGDYTCGQTEPPPPSDFSIYHDGYYDNQGDPNNLGTGCMVDGIERPCSEAMRIVNNGAGVELPPGVSYINPVWNSKHKQFQTAIFRATADGGLLGYLTNPLPGGASLDRPAPKLKRPGGAGRPDGAGRVAGDNEGPEASMAVPLTTGVMLLNAGFGPQNNSATNSNVNTLPPSPGSNSATNPAHRQPRDPCFGVRARDLDYSQSRHYKADPPGVLRTAKEHIIDRQ